MQLTDNPTTTIAPIKSVPLPVSTQDITNQGSHSPRALKAVSPELQPSLTQNLWIREAVQPLFYQLHIRYIDIISNILFNSDLELILRLRLVSKACWFASIKNIDIGCNPLTDKAAISFQHSQLHPSTNQTIKEKYSFATDNKTEIKVFITIADLLNPSSTLNSFSEDKLKLVLQIASHAELNQTQQLFENQPGTKFINKIKELDFKLLDIKNNLSAPINLLFNTITQNLKFFSSFTSLSIGNIEAIAFNPSDSLNNLTNLTIWSVTAPCTLNLPDSFNNLKNFTIGCVEKGAMLMLPNSAKNLIKLHIGKIEANGTFTLPAALDNLTDFSIGSTWSSTATVNLPASLDNLINLSIECVEDNTILNLPNADNVTNLSIKEVKSNSTLNLSNSLKNLRDFTILTISTDCNLNLPALTNFSILCFEKPVQPDSDWTSIFTETKTKAFNFSVALTGPTKNLFIDDIDHIQLILPDEFNSLETLTIGNISLSSSQCFGSPKTLDKLKSLVIGNIDISFKGRFWLPDSLASLEILNIGNVSLSSTHYLLGFPKTLNKLKSLVIGNIDVSSDGHFWLPDSLDSLERLTIGNVNFKGDGFKLPKALNKLKSLLIGDIFYSTRGDYKSISFILSNSLNSLETLSIGNINLTFGRIQLPQALDKLKSLIIGNIFDNKQSNCKYASFILPNSLNSLETLTIGNVHHGYSCIILPQALDKLKSLIIGDVYANSFVLPDSLDSLETLTLGNIDFEEDHYNGLHGPYVREFKFPKTLNKLKSLIIGDIRGLRIMDEIQPKILPRLYRDIILPEVLDNLTKLSLGYISESCKVKWPHSLSNLIDLTLNGCHANLKIVKQFSVQTVSYDPSQYQDEGFFSQKGSREKARINAINSYNQRILQPINELINVVATANHPAKAADLDKSSENCFLQ